MPSSCSYKAEISVACHGLVADACLSSMYLLYGLWDGHVASPQA